MRCMNSIASQEELLFRDSQTHMLSKLTFQCWHSVFLGSQSCIWPPDSLSFSKISSFFTWWMLSTSLSIYLRCHTLLRWMPIWWHVDQCNVWSLKFAYFGAMKAKTIHWFWVDFSTPGSDLTSFTSQCALREVLSQPLSMSRCLKKNNLKNISSKCNKRKLLHFFKRMMILIQYYD